MVNHGGLDVVHTYLANNRRQGTLGLAEGAGRRAGVDVGRADQWDTGGPGVM